MNGVREFTPARLDLADDVGQQVCCHGGVRESVLPRDETLFFVIDSLDTRVVRRATDASEGSGSRRPVAGAE
jgi:hypothetical protein